MYYYNIIVCLHCEIKKTIMKRYDSIENVKYDKSLIGEEVWAFNKLDGQNFGVKYSSKQKDFVGFTSRKCNVDETSEMFGDAVRYFKKNYADVFREIIIENSKKKGIFNGVEEITLFFEWYGENSFAGFHNEKDELKLALIDVFLKKKGFIEPKNFYELFYNNDKIIVPEVIYRGKLTDDFIKSINDNDWTKEDCKYPNVKEGVVIKRSTQMKGQRLPMCKTKTVWWLNKLHDKYNEEECKLLE